MLQRLLGHAPQIDPSAYIHPRAVLIGQVTVGPGSNVWPNATLRGDDGPIVIGASTSVQDGAVIHMTEGRSTTTVGDRVTIGHNAIIHGCTIEDETIIGMGAILLDNAVIGSRCIVGAGTVVPPGKRVDHGSVVVGNPMRVLRRCTQADLEFIEYSWRAYVARAAQYAAEEPPTP
jgi:carbonic anhydrase/acetyltransferase-like protein (isoleucine patch superfamily)